MCDEVRCGDKGGLGGGAGAHTVAVCTLRLTFESDGEVCSNTTSCSGLHVTASHFWRLGFFFLRLKKQQHLEERKEA